MSLILCLEDSAGNDTNLEVLPDDDFETFLLRAKTILGYRPPLTDITEGKIVSMSDNIYRFLIDAERSKGYDDEPIGEDDGGEEFGEIEYLSEDENTLYEQTPELMTISKMEPLDRGDDSEEFMQTEYLEEDSDEPGIVDVEILDSSLEDSDAEENRGGQEIIEEDASKVFPDKNLEDKLSKLEEEIESVENALSDLLMVDPQEPRIDEKSTLYTKEDLLDMLGDSPEIRDEGNFTKKSQPPSDMMNGQIRTKGSRKEYMDKYGSFRDRINKQSSQMKSKLERKNLKELKRKEHLRFLRNRKLKNREIRYKNSDHSDDSEDEESEGLQLSSFDLAMLKRTIRQPKVTLVRLTEEEIKSYQRPSTPDSPKMSLDFSRYLPSNYEDVDNEGVYDYMDMSIHNQELLTVRKNKNIFLDRIPKKPIKEKEDVVKAVRGINKMMGIHKKFSPVPQGQKRPRGRPRKYDKISGEPLKRELFEYPVDSHMTYLESVVKTEPIDDGDDDYIPGQNVDWLKNKKTKDKFKERYSCRMCGFVFPQLKLAINHALSHRVAGKAVFPCILCAYGFTTFNELQKHMKHEHHQKKSPKKSPVAAKTYTPKPKIKQPPNKKIKLEHPDIKPSMIYDDEEEVCNVEMLEEWLEDEEEEQYMTMTDESKKPIEPTPDDDDYMCGEVEYLEEEEDEIEEIEQLQQQQQQQHQQQQQDEEEVDDETKEAFKEEEEREQDFQPSGDEEWLLEEEEVEAAIASDESDAEKEFKLLQKKKGRRSKSFGSKCKSCLNYYSSEEMLTHDCSASKIISRGTKGSHRCALCGQTFPTRRRLIYHRSFHQVELLGLKQSCEKCPDRKFLSEADLFDHINNEHNIDFICTHQGCDKKFHLRSALRAHARIHGKKCHQCNVCGKQFYDVHNLKEHNITHLAVKPFQCHICLKFLNRKSRLRMHLLSHESFPVENCVLSCRHCKMAFKDAADAEAHVLDSDECCNSILSTFEESKYLTVFCRLEEDRAASKNLMDAIDEQVPLAPSPENLQAEATVDDIVNETLAKNGIVSVPPSGMIETNQIHIEDTSNEILAGDESMKALLAEVGAVKLMLTEDEMKQELVDSVKGDAIIETVSNQAETLHNQELMEVSDEVKDFLANVGTEIQPMQEEKLNACDNFLMNNVSELNKDKQDNEMIMSITMNEIENLELIKASEECTKLMENSEITNEADIKVEMNEDDGMNKLNTANKTDVTEEELLSQLRENTKNFIKVVRIKMVFRCEYCEKSFYTKEALNNHRASHDGLRNPFVCNICNAAFSTFARCTSHKTTHGFYKLNTDEEKEKSVQEVTGYEAFPVIKYFLCQHCHKTFLHWTYLQVHRRHKHGKGTYYFNCRICGDKFLDSWSLNSHRRKDHAELVNSIKKSSNTSYKCADCGEGFNKRIQLAKHRLDEHGDPSLMQQRNKPGPFACTMCSKMYQTKVGLDGHMRNHSGGLYLCDLCGNGFAHRAGLETHHRRVHLREQRYICRECGQHFFAPGELDSHKRCHTGEKPFKCDYCPMSFRTKGRKNEHHRIHTGERPYPCDMCSMSFRRSNAMKNHRLTHTGERRFSCPHCPKLFHIPSNLKSHIKLKHPDKYAILEVKNRHDMHTVPMDQYNKSEVMLEDDVTQEIPPSEPGQMLVLEDVIIEDESEEILRQDGAANIMEYTYSTEDIGGHVQNVMPEEYSEEKESKVHIQLIDGTDDGQGLLYAVGEEAADGDMHLIEGEVSYALVGDVGDDKQQQFAIIDNDQFIKEETDTQDAVYYS